MRVGNDGSGTQVALGPVSNPAAEQAPGVGQSSWSRGAGGGASTAAEPEHNAKGTWAAPFEIRLYQLSTPTACVSLSLGSSKGSECQTSNGGANAQLSPPKSRKSGDKQQELRKGSGQPAALSLRVPSRRRGAESVVGTGTGNHVWAVALQRTAAFSTGGAISARGCVTLLHQITCNIKYLQINKFDIKL